VEPAAMGQITHSTKVTKHILVFFISLRLLQKISKMEPDSFRRELLNSDVNTGGRTARYVNALPEVDEKMQK